MRPAGCTDNTGSSSAAACSVESVLGLKRHIRAVLDLQDDRRLDDLHRMPLSLGNVHAVVPGPRVEQDAFHRTAHAVVEDHEHPPSEDGVGLGRMPVSVDGNHGARKQGVEQALGLGVKGVVEVQVHPQAGTLLRLCL